MTPSSHERDSPSGESQKYLDLLIQTAVVCDAVALFCVSTSSNATLALGAKVAAVTLRMIADVLRKR